MSWWVLAGAGIVGYLVGALSPATFLARRRGVDLSATGSGNPGATNAGRVLGRRFGVAVGLLDVAKGFAPACCFGLAQHEAGLLAGFAAVVGHVTSPYLRGRGGRGVATTAGAVLGSFPWLALLVFATWAVVVLLARRVAAGSVAAAVALPVGAPLLGARGWTLGWAAALGLLVVGRHWSHVRGWLARR
jgi:glycerol-3-phosphate acyltransferase PlsY